MGSHRKRVRLIDSTLRDGSHALSHQFRREDVVRVARGLDEAGVGTIEISHGDGLGGSSFNYGFSREDELELLSAAAQVVRQARLAVLLLPGIGTKEELAAAYERGARVARIATHCTEADIAIQHIGMAKEMGMEAIGFLMLAHMIGPDELLRQARIMQEAGADCVYVTDSAGALTPRGTKERVRALVDGLQVAVGIHAHNNLGLAVANSLAAVEEGASHVDGCLGGLGAGAGNAPLEVVAAVLELEGYETGVDWLRLIEASEQAVLPIMARPQTIDGPSLVMGYAGVYSSFLLHTFRAAERFGVDPKQIILELGRRKVVGGEEDKIVEVAAQLAARHGHLPSPKE